MQIREQGRQIQLIKAEYNPEKKRSFAKVIAHIDRATGVPSDEVWAKLDELEQLQLKTWLASRASAAKKQEAIAAPDLLKGLVDAVPLMAPEAAEQVWQGIAALQKALKKAGHKKPVRAPVRKENPAQLQIPGAGESGA